MNSFGTGIGVGVGVGEGLTVGTTVGSGCGTVAREHAGKKKSNSFFMGKISVFDILTRDLTKRNHLAGSRSSSTDNTAAADAYLPTRSLMI